MFCLSGLEFILGDEFILEDAYSAKISKTSEVCEILFLRMCTIHAKHISQMKVVVLVKENKCV